jgi:Icc-related predicted phosphoesterase
VKLLLFSDLHADAAAARRAVDRSSSGQSLGSVAVRDTIIKVRSVLVVCGHIHASGGQQGSIGSTPVVHAGQQGVKLVSAL